MNKIVEISNLVKIYKSQFKGHVEAINDISFFIEKGQIYGLLGPNGSGKTTTMKLMLGLLKPTSGKIQIFGQNPDSLTIKQEIGYLPEESYLYKHLSAYQTMNYFSALMGKKIPQVQKKIWEILEEVGLQKSANRPVREYSKGMMRRLGLALILLKDPQLIFLDEPTIGLDPIGAREFKKLIEKFKSQNKTVLLSSHLLSEIEDLCDQIFIIQNGQLIRQGALKDLLSVKSMFTIELEKLSMEQKQKIDQWFLLNKIPYQWNHPRKTLEQLFVESLRL